MFNPKVARWGGAAFMLGNALFIVNKLNEMSRIFLSRSIPDVIAGDDIALIFVGQVVLIAGYVAFWLYAERVQRFGKIAMRLFAGGGIVLALGHVAFTDLMGDLDLFILVIIGLAVMLLGLILFGVANMREPILARWRWLPLATGVMGFVGFFLFSGEEVIAIFLVFRTLFALGLIGLGLTLLLEESRTHEAVASAA